jgi:predicted kinase
VVLVMLSGLPGVGKSALADGLGRALPAVVVSVDPIEAAILRSGIPQSFETGVAAYVVGAAVAEHQLRLGLDVVADAANLVEPGRDTWREAAAAAGAEVVVIEVVCTDERAHRRRLEARGARFDPYPEPTWDEVMARERDPWTVQHLVLDTSRADSEELLAAALAHLRGRRRGGPGPAGPRGPA